MDHFILNLLAAALVLALLFVILVALLDWSIARTWKRVWMRQRFRWRPLRRAGWLGVVGLGLALAACASLKPAQVAEQAETAAELAYAATATSLNAIEAARPADVAAAEAIKVKAWAVLVQVRAAYGAGQDISALLAQLQALQAQAKAL